MIEYITIHSKRLEVSFMKPQTPPYSCRFDSAAMAEKVILDGKYSFAVLENEDRSRRRNRGTGLCSEYVFGGIAEKTMQGEQFPKFGVGLLTQEKDNAPYHIFNLYEVKPFPIHYEVSDDQVVFEEDAVDCQGYAVKLRKTAKVIDNHLVIETTATNMGTKELKFFEYQHNFVNIVGKRTGPGYILEIPFDATVQTPPNVFPNMPPRASKVDLPDPKDTFVIDGNRLMWKKEMEGYYSKHLEAENILDIPKYYWKLSHSDSPAWVSETLCVKPERVVMWGVSHCICVEMYVPINIKPGESYTWIREWEFGC